MNAARSFFLQDQSQNSSRFNLQARCQHAELRLKQALCSLSLLCELCELAEQSHQPLCSVDGLLASINDIMIQVYEAREAMHLLHEQSTSRA